MSSFNRMQRSLFWRPKRTCSGRSILISCIETLATRFARRCNSCSSGDRRLTSNSSPNWDPLAATPGAGSISSSGSGSACCSNSVAQVGELRLDGRPRARLQGHGYESRQHFQRSSQRCRGSLRAEQRRQRIGRPVARAGGYHVAHRMMQLIRCALDALEIVAKRSHDCLFHRAGFLCHTGFRGSFARNTPSLHFAS